MSEEQHEIHVPTYPELTIEKAFKAVNNNDIQIAPGAWFSATGKVCAVGALVVAERGLDYAQNVRFNLKKIAKEIGTPVEYLHGLNDGFELWRPKDPRAELEDADRANGVIDGSILRWSIEEDEDRARGIKEFLELIGCTFEEESAPID